MQQRLKPKGKVNPNLLRSPSKLLISLLLSMKVIPLSTGSRGNSKKQGLKLIN